MLLEADSGSTGFLEPPDLPKERKAELDPGTKLGPYRIESCLARGGMGSVFLARRDDREFERTVAIKQSSEFRDKTSLESFRRERQTLARLNHPQIARLFDGGTTEDHLPYLVMEYVEDGLPIDEYCTNYGLSSDQRLALFRSVLRGVEYAHSNLIIHRDLKPSNILVDSPCGSEVARLWSERSLRRKNFEWSHLARLYSRFREPRTRARRSTHDGV